MNVERRGSVRQPDSLVQLGITQEEARPKAKPFTIDRWRVYEAFCLVKANAGSAGVDNQSIADFEENLKDNLYKLWNRMSSGTYMPPPVKGVPIPKKSGGERLLGIPTVSDRIAQMVVKLEFEPAVEPHFLPDSYGYRPNKSALDAIAVTRKRCWRYDWVLEFDIKGLFDNIPQDLLLKAVDKHTDSAWVRLYIRRWLTAPMQLADDQLIQRDKGTPQGGVISPVLANLFLHYVFDKWMQKFHLTKPWCRYADDGLVHCRSEAQANYMLKVLRNRFEECGLELHPEKTKIVYCKDERRDKDYHTTAFDFLGYTFRRRCCKDRGRNRMFVGFVPAVSDTALKNMRQKIRKMRIRSRTDLSLIELANWINPIIRGWLTYYGAFYNSKMYSLTRHVDKTLVRWIMRKCKLLRGRKHRAVELLEKAVLQRPKLFAHWQMGVANEFV